MSNSPQDIWVMPFFQYMVSQVNRHRSLWGVTGSIINMCICHGVGRPFVLSTQPLFITGFHVWRVAQVLKQRWELWLSTKTSALRLLSNSWFLWLINTIIGCPSILPLRTLYSISHLHSLLGVARLTGCHSNFAVYYYNCSHLMGTCPYLTYIERHQSIPLHQISVL